MGVGGTGPWPPWQESLREWEAQGRPSPGGAVGGAQVLGKGAAWPFSRHIQSQPKGTPDGVSASRPGAQASETLNIQRVGWLPSLVIKTLISYFTQDGQGGHGLLSEVPWLPCSQRKWLS